MKQFPGTSEYTGLNTPIGEEYIIDSLLIDGRIPPGIEGTFFRAVPDPAFPPYMEDGGAILSGDGMVSALRLGAGRASFAMRYVQTERHRAEVAAGRALWCCECPRCHVPSVPSASGMSCGGGESARHRLKAMKRLKPGPSALCWR